jgi:hypothetical protein
VVLVDYNMREMTGVELYSLSPRTGRDSADADGDGPTTRSMCSMRPAPPE